MQDQTTKFRSCIKDDAVLKADVSKIYETEMMKRCPINAIKVVTTGNTPPGYESSPFTAGYDIVWSRNANNLPLTEFLVGEAVPCMDRFQPLSLKTNPVADLYQINEFETYSITEQPRFEASAYY